MIPDLDKSQLAQRIHYVRTEIAHMTQTQFCRELDMAPATYYNYANAANYPNARILHAICVRFGVSANWLLGLEDNI